MQCRGTVQFFDWMCFSGAPLYTPILPAMVDQVTPIHFVVGNASAVWKTATYRITSRSADGDLGNQAVSLNGLPPGESIYGIVNLAPGDSAEIPCSAVLLESQPLNINEVVLMIDPAGGSQHVPAAVVGLQTCTLDIAEVSDPLAPAPVGRFSIDLSATPNPFFDQTGIRFALGADQAAVHVGVFV